MEASLSQPTTHHPLVVGERRFASSWNLVLDLALGLLGLDLEPGPLFDDDAAVVTELGLLDLEPGALFDDDCAVITELGWNSCSA